MALTSMPSMFFAGDSFELRILAPDNPGLDWVLTLSLNGGQFFNKQAVWDGEAHLFTVTPQNTGGKPSGVYSWAIFANFGDIKRQTLSSGTTWIKPNPQTEVLSHDRECLELIRAHIKGRLPQGLLSHTINGTPIVKISLKDAMELEATFLARVNAEDRAKLAVDGYDGIIDISFAR